MKFAYYFKSESTDAVLIMSDTDYADVYDFMKHEMQEEYDAWIADGYVENEIPYCDYAKVSDEEPFAWI